MSSRFLFLGVLPLVVFACGGETVNVGSTSQMELKKKADGSPTGNGTTCSWDDAVSSDGNVSSSPNGPYTVGDRFPSPDGCNTCQCTTEGIGCTFMACNTPPGKACTEEAKQCPDGSYVSRTGPNCEFAPCPGAGENCPAIARICNDGSTAKTAPGCKQVCPEDSGCVVGGCSGEICSNQDVAGTCEWKPEYACYKTATCELQANGQCGWTQTAQLTACLANP